MGESKVTKVHSKVEVMVYNLSLDELRVLADHFRTAINTCKDNKLKWVQFKVPHTLVIVTYYGVLEE
jgi:hypothetical protein